MSNQESQDFVVKYISNCVKNGIAGGEDICKDALREIALCDEAIAAGNRARLRKERLADVLHAFNHESARRLRGNKINTEERPDESSDEFKATMSEICTLIKTNKPMKAAQIVDCLGGMSVHARVYGAIKKLGVLGIIKRDDESFFHPGDNWSERAL